MSQQQLPTANAVRPVLSANAIPLLSQRNERFIRAFAALAYAYAVYWVVWRWTSSLNWNQPVFSIVLVLAETFGLVSMAFFLFTVWRLERREPPPAPAGRSVDVYITCYDEPLQLLRRTALGARAIRYPHQTFVLDDGKRDEVEAMCAELGIGYIRRDGNEHAKAGNLNNALKVTHGEFVLQLDADHVPLPNIVDRMLGYFTDERVAFVQSPQDFYNTDSFTHVMNDDGRRLWEENRLFFSLIQPGKDRINAAFFCGSCGLLRRSAFEEIGGFSTETITEDMETSMILHAAGWKSCYHGETLAYGLAPASAAQYHVQRLRWGQGAMQILRRMNPLRRKGLDWKQRLSYFASVIVYLDGVQRLVFYVAPLMFFLFGVLPVNVDNRQLLIRLVPYIFGTIGSFELLSRGTGYILISERYNMTRFWTYILATYGFFTNRKLKFNVTPKGASDVPFGTYAPQLVLAIVSVVAVLWALVARHYGWIDYKDGGGLSTAFLVNGVWVGWNFYFAMDVVRRSIRSRQQRADHRFAERLPMRVRVLDEDTEIGDAVLATTGDINSSGLSFRCHREFPAGTRLRIPLDLASSHVITTGVVTHSTPTQVAHGTVYTHGVQFSDLDFDARDAIELHSAHHSIPQSRQHFRQSVPLITNAIERFVNPRDGRRRTVGMPVLIGPVSEDGASDLDVGLLEEESVSGVRLILENPIDPGTTVRWEVPGTDLVGEGVVVFSRALESPMRVRFVVGVERARPRTDMFQTIRSWVTPAAGTRRHTA